MKVTFVTDVVNLQMHAFGLATIAMMVNGVFAMTASTLITVVHIHYYLLLTNLTIQD
jgi:hypothetical protein